MSGTRDTYGTRAELYGVVRKRGDGIKNGRMGEVSAASAGEHGNREARFLLLGHPSPIPLESLML